AVAMLQSLAMPKWWPKARAIAASARLHGVAFALKASPHTLSLELARDGQRALALGDDGVVRVCDLAKHDTKMLATVKGAASARFANADRTVVVYGGNRLTLVDTQTGVT